MSKLRRILVVEDDADIQVIAQMVLEEVGGYEVQICESGAQALERVRSWTPDLLLLDVMLPVMDGPAILAAIRALPSLSRVPAIFMTAKVQPDEVQAYQDLDVLGVISKPFNPMQLTQRIEELWSTRR